MTDWDGAEHLDRRMITMTAVLTAAIAAVAAVLVVSGLLSSGSPVAPSMLVVLFGMVAVIGLSVGVDYIRWRATTYRITEERLELRFSFVVNRRRSLARDRIRTVDVTASPVQRLFGIAAVVIGTGESGESELKLDAVSRERAHQLRGELLRHAASDEPRTDDGVLAELDWRWAAYAPLSVLTLALGAAAVGAVANVASWFGDTDDDVVGSVVSDLVIAAALVGYVTLAVGVVLAGAIGALLLFVEMWWGYRLDREPGGTLHVRRGLLTTRSISLEERRLRGADIVEPLGVRLARAGRVDAIATGIRDGGAGQSKRTDHKTLLPAAPRAVALRVTSDVLRASDVSGALTSLTPHPRAARSRRLRWALAPVAMTFAALLTVELAAGERIASAAGPAFADLVAAMPWVFAVIAVPVAVLLALDAYRNLGHGISDRYLVARRGSVRRSTALLQRTGVIGWTVRQSIFQRRAGLVTLEATTAAGSGAYTIPDVDVAEGIAFADDAVPGLLAEFVERPRESQATALTREREH